MIGECAPGARYVVAVVVDPQFGERLRQLAERVDMWAVPSPINTPVVQDIWTANRKRESTQQLTMWSHTFDLEAADDWLTMFEDIELHHGHYSHDPPVSVLEIYGAEPTSVAIRACRALGYDYVETTSYGFRAVRPPAA